MATNAPQGQHRTIPPKYRAEPERYTALPILRTMRSPNASVVLSRMIFVLLVITVLVLTFVPWQQSIPGSGRVIDRHVDMSDPGRHGERRRSIDRHDLQVLGAIFQEHHAAR